MSGASKSMFVLPVIGLSFWLALTSALVAFSIVSNNPLLAFSIGLGAVLINSLSQQIPKGIRYTARVLFTFTCYLIALFPLWPENLSSYYYSAPILIVSVSALAAFNTNSHGGSRGVTSITAIVFLLLARNIFLYFNFEAPTHDLSLGIAFIATMEIALSNRYQKSNDSPHPEIAFGLLLAFIASFHISSLPLALLLTLLPVAAFLLRNQELAKNANEHTSEATPLNPSNKRSRLSIHLPLLATPLLLAGLFYLLTLRVPFWGDFLPARSPYFAKAIADKAAKISEAADLDNDSIETFADSLLDPTYLREKAADLTEAWNSEKQNEPETASHQIPDKITTPQPYIPPSQKNGNRYSEYKVPSPEFTNQTRTTPQEKSTTSQSEDLRKPSIVEAIEQPPMYTVRAPSLGSGVPDDLDTMPFEQAPGSRSGNSGLIAFKPAETPSEPTSQPAETGDPSDFGDFINSFERPGEAISQALNLQGSDVSSLLSEEPIVLVKLKNTRDAPSRLYLRSNVLDTFTKAGFEGNRANSGQVEIIATDERVIDLDAFRQSKSSGNAVTITSDLSRRSTLPLPYSFGRLQVFQDEKLTIHPEDLVAVASLSTGPLTYRLFDTDLEVKNNERTTSTSDELYRQRMLEVPLDSKDRRYLRDLANRVGGKKSTAQQFASRFESYFSNNHPYSYFVNIPEGRGHPIVRWLRNDSPGLCSNYAAAFTLLARTRDIPTRVVSGFATDEFERSEKRFVIRQKNAHAWVEYLNESNQWIRFDPTPTISQAELKRTQQYTSSPKPEDLQRLIDSEIASLHEEPATEEDSSDEIASLFAQIESLPSIEISAPEQAQEREPQPLPSPDAIPEPLIQSQPSAESAMSAPSPEPTVEPSAEIDKVPEQSLSREPRTPGESTETRELAEAEEPSSPPWLLLLATFSLLIPAAWYFVRTKRNTTAAPELQLRSQAGRLLTRLDSLIQQRQLQDDPIWTETRQSLSEQRYGRGVSPLLVKDLAVKVSILSKNKDRPKKEGSGFSSQKYEYRD